MPFLTLTLVMFKLYLEWHKCNIIQKETAKANAKKMNVGDKEITDPYNATDCCRSDAHFRDWFGTLTVRVIIDLLLVTNQ